MEWIWVLVVVLILLAMVWIAYAPNTFPLFSTYTEEKEEHQKQQWVRLLDIVLLGPLGLLLAYQLWKDGWRVWPPVLVVYAAGTMIYNFGNYRLNQQAWQV